MMEKKTLASLRPFLDPEDYDLMLNYFFSATPEFLCGMGVDRSKLPDRLSWRELLRANHRQPLKEQDRSYVAWIHQGKPIGHSNINKITFGAEANIHLHLWYEKLREAGLGRRFFRMSALYFFEHFKLERLICEPWAENPAPNRVLVEAGFRFVKRYRTTPGLINFEQDVNRYEINKTDLA